MKNQQSAPVFISLLLLPILSLAQFPNLRSVAPFSLFTTTGAVSNNGVSTITGKVGTNAGAITGFTFSPGQEENGNTVTASAASDLQLAYNEIHLTAATAPLHAPVLGNGETLFPGVFAINQAGSIAGTLFLDAQGNSDAQFIINVNGALSPGPSSEVVLLNGAQSCNVYWAVEGGEVAIATLADMKGTFIANPGAVSMAASSELEGRLLSTTGAVAVDGVIVNLPICLSLPVTLINFKAARDNAFVKLSWTVDSESSFAGYDMERSADGRNFYKVGEVGAINSSGVKTYQWIDNSPLALKNFYRLKMIDIDNGFTYSSILIIAMTGKKSILVYPNPVRGHTLLLQMSGQLKGVHQLGIYDLIGRKVMQDKILQSEQNTVTRVVLDPKIATGIYYLQITDPKNDRKTIRISIQ